MRLDCVMNNISSMVLYCVMNNRRIEETRVTNVINNAVFVVRGMETRGCEVETRE